MARTEVWGEDEIRVEGLKLLGNLPAAFSFRIGYGNTVPHTKIFGPGIGSENAFDYLSWGYERALQREALSGSWGEAADQLRTLASAAEAFVSAMEALNGAAQGALHIPSDAIGEELWRKAGGDDLLLDCQRIAKETGRTPEQISLNLANGCLPWKYPEHEIEALVKLCRLQAGRLANRQEEGQGIQSAARDCYGSPVYQLVEHAALALEACGQSLDSTVQGEPSNLKKIVRLVHEWVTGKPPLKRWAEREVRAVICAHTTPPAVSP